MAARYPIGAYLRQAGTLLDIAPERVLRRIGLSTTLAADDDISVGAEVFFQLWEAVCAEADRPGVEMDLAMAYAHGPFIPPVFAFSCADTLGLGLQRLCDFKPLVGPFQMEVTRPDERLRLTMRASTPELSIPHSMGLFELFYITECARTFTGVHLSPVSTSLPGQGHVSRTCTEYLGAAPKVGKEVSLTFSAVDAARPLITRSASLWETLEPGFTEQLNRVSGATTLSGQIKLALLEALPGGSTAIEDMARRLNVSKRSLQRRLSAEGTSFQELLNEARFEMSQRYLRNSGLSVPEISYLLGFRETSSFFRAFHGWTGMTPGDFRAKGPQTLSARLH